MTEKNEINDKPLDKMTVTELREVAKELPDITGTHGMKKAELLEAVKQAKGIKEEHPKKSTAKPKSKKTLSTKEIKAMIKTLKGKRTQALADKDKKQATIYRRKISRLKKKTRQAA